MKNEQYLTTSCRDDANRYSQSQERWREFSTQTIQLCKSKLPHFKSFAEAYAFLGDRRQQIAKELNHGSNSDWRYFGALCEEGLTNHEAIIDEKNRNYTKQIPYIVKELKDLVALSQGEPDRKSNYYTYSSGEEKEGKETIEWHYFVYKPPKFDSENLPYDKETLTSVLTSIIEVISEKHTNGRFLLYNSTVIKDSIKSPSSIMPEPFYTSICLYKKKGSPDSPYSIRVNYAHYNKYNLIGDYLIAQLLYDKLMAWKPENGIESFLCDSGKLAHFLANRLFARRGAAAMTEWLIRSVAECKEIELGKFKDNDIGWHWKALVTPNPDEYATWYQMNVFELPVTPKQECETQHSEKTSAETKLLPMCGTGITAKNKAGDTPEKALKKETNVGKECHASQFFVGFPQSQSIPQNQPSQQQSSSQSTCTETSGTANHG